MIKIASVIVVSIFCTLLIVFFCLFAFGLAHLLTLAIRIFKPNFATLPHHEDPKEISQANTKKIALDFLFERKRQELRRQHEQSVQPAMQPVVQPIAANVKEDAEAGWDLSALNHLINAPRIPKTTIYSEAKRTEDKAEYCLLRYFTLPDGRQFPRFLCTKLSQRGRGLRVAFASVSGKRIKLDFVSAMRLAEAIGPDVLLQASNAAARVTMKRKEKEHDQHATA